MFRKTVDGVLRALSKAVTDLEVVAEQQRGIALGAIDEIVRQQIVRASAELEAERAARVKAKIEELIR